MLLWSGIYFCKSLNSHGPFKQRTNPSSSTLSPILSVGSNFDSFRLAFSYRTPRVPPLNSISLERHNCLLLLSFQPFSGLMVEEVVSTIVIMYIKTCRENIPRLVRFRNIIHVIAIFTSITMSFLL